MADFVNYGKPAQGQAAFVSVADQVADRLSLNCKISLRDWLAGQAIAGVCASDIDFESADWDGLAEYAYRCADAMLKAREKKP